MRELDAIIVRRGRPLTVVSDTAPSSPAWRSWSQDRQVDWDYIAPGKPMQNGYRDTLFDQLADGLGHAMSDRRYFRIVFRDSPVRRSIEVLKLGAAGPGLFNGYSNIHYKRSPKDGRLWTPHWYMRGDRLGFGALPAGDVVG